MLKGGRPQAGIAPRPKWIRIGRRAVPQVAIRLVSGHSRGREAGPKMNSRKTPIELLFVVAPHSLLLDIAGPAEAFRLANLALADRKQPPRFSLRFAGPASNAVTSVGLPLTTLEPLPK